MAATTPEALSAAPALTGADEDLYALVRTPKFVATTRVALSEGNPVFAMPREAFLVLLEQLVATSRFTEGRPQTKTGIQLARGLQVLRDGALPGPRLTEDAYWDWPELSRLNVHPFVASVYLRMVRELRAATTA